MYPHSGDGGASLKVIYKCLLEENTFFLDFEYFHLSIYEVMLSLHRISALVWTQTKAPPPFQNVIKTDVSQMGAVLLYYGFPYHRACRGISYPY